MAGPLVHIADDGLEFIDVGEESLAPALCDAVERLWAARTALLFDGHNP